jgi:hypothetical protein
MLLFRYASVLNFMLLLKWYLQAHFGLSSLENWNDIENCDFDYVLFFNNCVKLLKDTPDDEWVVDTLKFLTRYFISVIYKLPLPFIYPTANSLP